MNFKSFRKKQTALLRGLVIMSVLAFGFASCEKEKAAPEAASVVVATPVAATPSFSKGEGSYDADIAVVISTTTTDATIHYTTDGGTPSAASLVYSSPIAISGNGTVVPVKAIAVKDGYETSNVASATYTINYKKAPSPKFINDDAIVYNGYVELAFQEDGTNIYYNINKDYSPVPYEGIKYAGAVVLNRDSEDCHLINDGTQCEFIVQAIATKANRQNSAVYAHRYVINIQKVSAPVFNPETGVQFEAFISNVTVTSPNADVYCSVVMDETPIADGLCSTVLARIDGNHAVDLNHVTITAVASMSGDYSYMAESDPVVAEYTINNKVNNPTISPDVETPAIGGEFYEGSVYVTITDEYPFGATLYFTENSVDGEEAPTPAVGDENTKLYSGSFYTSDMTGDDDGNAAVKTKKIKVIAVVDGMISGEASISYEINTDMLSIPALISPEENKAYDRELTIQFAPIDADIYYTVTTDGSEPTVPTQADSKYTAPEMVLGNLVVEATSVQIKAVAYKDGMDPSSVMTLTAFINNNVPQPSILDITETESSDFVYDRTISLVNNFVTENESIACKMYYSTDGSEPSIEYTAPFEITGDVEDGKTTNVTVNAVTICDGMLDSPVASDTFILDNEQSSSLMFNPSDAYVYNGEVSGVTISFTEGSDYTNGTIYYVTCVGSSTDCADVVPSAESTLYTEAGFAIAAPVASIPLGVDGQFVTVKTIAIQEGFVDSEIAEITYTINSKKVATPVISGDLIDPASIQIKAPGAYIYYTTDNTDPSSNPLALFAYNSVTVVLESGQNLRAIGKRPLMTDSDEVSTSVVKPATPSVSLGGCYYNNGWKSDVTVTSASSDIEYYRYTTNGSTPSVSTGTQDSDGLFTVSVSRDWLHCLYPTVKAVAVKNSTASSVGSN